MITRDGFLFFLLGYGFVVALVLRGVVAVLPFETLSLYLAPAVPFIGGMLVGTVFGLALVEEREVRTALLLRVSPLSGRHLALYLGGATLLLAFVSGGIGAWLYGQPVVRPGLFVACLLAGAFGAPLLMVFLGAVASNKIEAMAIGKAAGIVTSVPGLLFVLPDALWWTLAWSPWTWLYLGLLDSFTPGGRLADLAITIPDLPDVVWPIVPVALMVPASLGLLRRYRRQVV